MIEADKFFKAEEWQETFDSITDLLFIQNNDYVILKANKAFYAALKLKPEEVIGKKCYEVLHKSATHWPLCPFEQTKNDKLAHTQEVQDVNIGIPLFVTVSPIFNKEGGLKGAVHIAKDISDIKHKENELIRKMRDLEIFQKAAIGRELVMIELKKKIKELETKLTGYGADTDSEGSG